MAKEGDKSVQEWLNSKEKPAGTGAEGSKSGDAAQEPPGLTAFDFFKMIFATLAVIALIYFLLRFIGKKNKFLPSGRYLENIGGTSLGQNRSIQLIKMGDKVLVVGVGENIQLIKEISDKEEAEEIIQSHNSREKELPDVKNVLKQLPFAPFKQSDEKTGASFADSLKQQMDEMKNERKTKLEALRKKWGDRQ